MNKGDHGWVLGNSKSWVQTAKRFFVRAFFWRDRIVFMIFMDDMRHSAETRVTNWCQSQLLRSLLDSWMASSRL